MSEPDWVSLSNNNSIFYSHSSNDAQPDKKESWGPLSFGLANFSLQVVIQALNASASIISEGRYPFSLSEELQQHLRRQLETAAVYLDDKYSDRLSGQLSPQELLHFNSSVDNLKTERTKKNLLSQSRSSSPAAATTNRPTSSQQTTSVPIEELEDRLLARSRAQQQHNQSSAPSIRAPTELNNIPRNTSASPTPVASSSSASASTGNNNNNNNNITTSSLITNNNQNQNKNSSSLKVTFVEPSANNNNNNYNNNNTMMSTGNSNNNNNSSASNNNEKILVQGATFDHPSGNWNHEELSARIVMYLDQNYGVGKSADAIVWFSVPIRGKTENLTWYGQLTLGYSAEDGHRLKDKDGNYIKVIVGKWLNTEGNRCFLDICRVTEANQHSVTAPFPVNGYRYAKVVIPSLVELASISTAALASNPSMSRAGSVSANDAITFSSTSSDDNDNNNDDDQQQDQYNRHNRNNNQFILPIEQQQQQQNHNIASSARGLISPQPINPGAGGFGLGENGMVSGGFGNINNTYVPGNVREAYFQDARDALAIRMNEEKEKQKFILKIRYHSTLGNIINNPESRDPMEDVCTFVRANVLKNGSKGMEAVMNDVTTYIHDDLGVSKSKVLESGRLSLMVANFRCSVQLLGDIQARQDMYLNSVELFKANHLNLLVDQKSYLAGKNPNAAMNNLMNNSQNMYMKLVAGAVKSASSFGGKNNRSRSRYNNNNNRFRSKSNNNNRGGGYNNNSNKNNNNNEDFKSKPCDKCALEGKQQAYFYCTEHNKNARGSLNSSAPPRS